MIRARVEDPRLAIVWAGCKAGLHDYPECNRIIQAVFAGAKAGLSARLRAARIYRELGMRSHALRELHAIACENQDLPAVCLLLGDILSSLGEHKKAALCRRLAVESGCPEGSLAASHAWGRVRACRLPARRPAPEGATART